MIVLFILFRTQYFCCMYYFILLSFLIARPLIQTVLAFPMSYIAHVISIKSRISHVPHLFESTNTNVNHPKQILSYFNGDLNITDNIRNRNRCKNYRMIGEKQKPNMKFEKREKLARLNNIHSG